MTSKIEGSRTHWTNLSIAVAAAEYALEEAENLKQLHLVGSISKKVIVLSITDVRELVEAGWAELERQGIIRFH